MEQTLILVLPVFCVMAAGYVTGKLKILGQDSSHALNAFVYYVAMPAMLFRAMATTDIVGLWDASLIAVFLIPQFIVHLVYALLAIYLFKRGFKESMLAGMAASWGNTVFMGFPLVQAAFGEEVISAMVIVTVVQTLIFMVGVLLIMDSRDTQPGGSGAETIKRSIASFVKNPAMMAAIVGMGFSVASVQLPPVLESFVGMLAPAAAPCALFAIGLFLTTQRLSEGLATVSLITVIKLIVCPALTVAAVYLAVSWGSTVPELWFKGIILMAATPTGTLAFVIAQKHRSGEDICSGSILLSGVVSIVTIPLLLTWL